MPINRLGSKTSTTYPGDKAYPPVFTPAGASYLRYKYEAITLSSGGLDISTASCWGITDILRTGNTTDATVSLAAPVIGCEKTFVNRSTAATSDYTVIDVDPGVAGIRIDGSSDGRYVKFSSLGSQYQSVTLIGLTTAIWTVKTVNSTVGTFNVAAGIRLTTAASSN